jgi:hypothetical protein
MTVFQYSTLCMMLVQDSEGNGALFAIKKKISPRDTRFVLSFPTTSSGKNPKKTVAPEQKVKKSLFVSRLCQSSRGPIKNRDDEKKNTNTERMDPLRDAILLNNAGVNFLDCDNMDDALHAFQCAVASVKVATTAAASWEARNNSL